MVEVTEIKDESSIPASQERQLDADEIESLCNNHVTRPSVKAHLTSLVQKIRRDANALKRMEDSRNKVVEEMEVAEQVEEVDVKEEEEKVIVEEVDDVKAPTPVPVPVPVPVPTASLSTPKYKSIDKFAFDAGSYNSPTVTIYITLPQINQIPKENIQCNFTPTSFDLTILNYNNQNHRLIKNNLEKEIDVNPKKSRIVIKANKIIIKLGKVKGEYGSYDNWTDLTSKKGKDSKMKGGGGGSASSSKSDPSASIMNMMKEMYDSGDDNMKKMIGETMLKQREGKLGDGPGAGDMDMGGMGGMGM